MAREGILPPGQQRLHGAAATRLALPLSSSTITKLRRILMSMRGESCLLSGAAGAQVTDRNPVEKAMFDMRRAAAQRTKIIRRRNRRDAMKWMR
jgi:hypothetical protein